MAKTKGAGSSSARNKRARQVEEESSDQDTQMGDESQAWTSKVPLSSLPEDEQLDAYRGKIARIKVLTNALKAERKANVQQFKKIGVTQCFERLGWEAVLTESVDENVYVQAVIEWMGTLRIERGEHPPKTIQLIGRVGNKEAILSFETLGKFTKLDSGPKGESRNYNYMSDAQLFKDGGSDWDRMVAELFSFPGGVRQVEDQGMKKLYLKPLPKLLLNIMLYNVLPQSSDLSSVQNYEIQTLYALTTGSPALSLRQIILSNVWYSRESHDKALIPHVRLLSKLLVWAKAVKKNAPSISIPSRKWDLTALSSYNMKVVKKKRVWRLIDESGKHNYDHPRDDPESGEDTEEEQERLRVEEEERRVAAAGTSSGAPAGLVAGRHPGYDAWPQFAQAMYDMNKAEAKRMTLLQEEQNRLTQEFQVSMIYAHELSLNNQYRYNEQLRHMADYNAGLPFHEFSPPVNWEALSQQLPRQPQPHPQSFASSWLPL